MEYNLFEKIMLGAIPVVFAITVHEVAHGWVAEKLGDPTARMQGRLTLNPIPHIHPVGTVLLPIVMLTLTNFVFGWAKPVPVDYRRLRRPKRDMALVAAAGPLANLLMLVIWALLARFVSVGADQLGDLAPALYFMAGIGIIINVVLMVLNLLPLPPLDGSRVVAAFLPPVWGRRYYMLERWGFVILVALLFTGALAWLLRPPIQWVLGGIDFLMRF